MKPDEQSKRIEACFEEIVSELEGRDDAGVEFGYYDLDSDDALDVAIGLFEDFIARKKAALCAARKQEREPQPSRPARRKSPHTVRDYRLERLYNRVPRGKKAEVLERFERRHNLKAGTAKQIINRRRRQMRPVAKKLGLK